MDWKSFAKACPEIAAGAEERLRNDQLAMLGTLRRDGTPRISPCEVDFAEDHLFLGMMWQSPKALDLFRDPRVVVHSVTCNKDGTDGEVKLYGRAVEITEASLRAVFRKAITARIDWAPDEPNYHLFSLDIERAAYVVFGGGEEKVMVWDPRAGFRRWSKRG